MLGQSAVAEGNNVVRSLRKGKVTRHILSQQLLALEFGPRPPALSSEAQMDNERVAYEVVPLSGAMSKFQPVPQPDEHG